MCLSIFALHAGFDFLVNVASKSGSTLRLNQHTLLRVLDILIIIFTVISEIHWAERGVTLNFPVPHNSTDVDNPVFGYRNYFTLGIGIGNMTWAAVVPIFYRFVRLLCINPMGSSGIQLLEKEGVKKEDAKGHTAANDGVRSAQLIWTARSLEQVSWAVDHLVETLEAAEKVHGKIAVRLLLSVQIFVTEPKTAELEAQMTKLVEDTPLQGKVHFGHPDYENLFASASTRYDKVAEQSGTWSSTMVAFCGNKAVGDTLASLTGLDNSNAYMRSPPARNFYFFRQEYYGNQQGTSKSFSQKGKSRNSNMSMIDVESSKDLEAEPAAI